MAFSSVAAFALSCIAIYGLIQTLPPSFTQPVSEHTARALCQFLTIAGIAVSAAGDTVSDGDLFFRIIPECTPLFTAGLFLCFVIFYPATFRQKATGLIAGLPALYLGNLVRLAMIFIISRHNRGLFGPVHAYLGQVFTVILVFLTCILWVKWLDKKEPGQKIIPAANFLVRFALISGCVFLVWMEVHHGYIRFLDQFMTFGFSLFNEHIIARRETPVYYETFSIVTFTSLVLAAGIPWRRKMSLLAAGLGFLFAIHLFHRVDNALVAAFHYTAFLTVDLTLLLIGQFLLPGLFLIYLLRRRNA